MLPRYLPLILALMSGPAAAQSAYRWVDHEGKVHYSDHPPPPKAAVKVEQKRLTAPAADDTPSYLLRKAMADFPITLWVSEECQTVCNEARAWLKKRGAPFNEKNVKSIEDLEALKALTGGEAQVPVLQIGSKTYKGWQQAEWQRLLDAAGYPEAKAQATKQAAR